MNKAQAEIKAIAAQLRAAKAPAPVASAPVFGSDPALQLLWQQLEDQIQAANQLITSQEAALLQLQAIVQQIEQNHSPNPDLSAMNSGDKGDRGDRGNRESTEGAGDAGDLFRAELGGTSLPPPPDRFRSSLFSATLPQQIVWENTWKNIWKKKTASIAVRLLFTVGAGMRAVGEAGIQGVRSLMAVGTKVVQAQPSEQRRHPHPHRQYQSPQPTEAIDLFPSVQVALSLTIGFALLRILLDWVVQLYPHLWLIGVLLMAMPAAVAIYRSTVVPQSGFLWGSRLTLILIGLLLGGRL